MVVVGMRAGGGALRRTVVAAAVKAPDKKESGKHTKGYMKAAKSRSVGAMTSLKPADEDRVFQLLEQYGDGLNYPSAQPDSDLERVQRRSLAYDRLQDHLDEMQGEVGGRAAAAQRRAVRSLPEVLSAAACRPCSATWPTGLRKPTMTPPVDGYTPPAVDTETMPDMIKIDSALVKQLDGVAQGKDPLQPEDYGESLKWNGEPTPLEEEERQEEERMRRLRDAYLWWKGQRQFGPRAETVHRDLMQMKHEQDVLLYTIRRAKHGANDYPRRRQMIVAPVLRDDTEDGVMYRKKKGN